MATNFDTRCKVLLGNTSNTIQGKEDKYNLYSNCISELNHRESQFEKYNKKKISEIDDAENVLFRKKGTLKKLKNKKLTFDEELISNKTTINFLVTENRITLGVILLLIFLIYKYILK